MGLTRRRRRSARLRLTLLYSGMFLVLGTAVIAVIYVFASSRGTVTVRAMAVPSPPKPVAAAGAPGASVIRQLVSPGVHAVELAQRSADVSNLFAASWVVLAITAVLSGLLGWFASGRVLRPLREMTATARTISAGSLGERLAVAGPNDEFKQLGDTLDDLLARLEASFEAQRRFVANASPEVRTPAMHCSSAVTSPCSPPWPEPCATASKAPGTCSTRGSPGPRPSTGARSRCRSPPTAPRAPIRPAPSGQATR